MLTATAPGNSTLPRPCIMPAVQQPDGATRKKAAEQDRGRPGSDKPGVCTGAEPRHQLYE